MRWAALLALAALLAAPAAGPSATTAELGSAASCCSTSAAAPTATPPRTARCWPAATRSSARSATSTRPTSRRTRRPGSAAGRCEQFIRAMREGRDPEGWPLYPAFPYTSYTRMTDEDLAALKAYLDALPAVSQASKPHELWFPFNLRWGLYLWQWLFFTPERFQPDPAKDAAWNRGAYLVLGPGHCAECHTPRTFYGVLEWDRAFAGGAARQGEGARTSRPNPTPRHRQVERRRPRHAPQARHDAGRRLRRLGDGQGGQQRHQQAARRRHRRHRRLSARACRLLECLTRRSARAAICAARQAATGGGACARRSWFWACSCPWRPASRPRSSRRTGRG